VNNSSTPQSLQVLFTPLAGCFALFGRPTCALSVSHHIESLSLRYTRGHQATFPSSLTLVEASEGQKTSVFSGHERLPLVEYRQDGTFTLEGYALLDMDSQQWNFSFSEAIHHLGKRAFLMPKIRRPSDTLCSSHTPYPQRLGVSPNTKHILSGKVGVRQNPPLPPPPPPSFPGERGLRKGKEKGLHNTPS